MVDKIRSIDLSFHRIAALAFLAVWAILTILPHLTMQTADGKSASIDVSVFQIAVAIACVMCATVVRRGLQPARFVALVVVGALLMAPLWLFGAPFQNDDLQALASSAGSLLNGLGFGILAISVRHALYLRVKPITALLEFSIAVALATLAQPICVLVAPCAGPFVSWAAAALAAALVGARALGANGGSNTTLAESVGFREGKSSKRIALLIAGVFLYGLVLAAAHSLYYATASDSPSAFGIEYVIGGSLFLAVSIAIALACLLSERFKIRYAVLVPLVLSSAFFPFIATGGTGFSPMLVSDSLCYAMLAWVIPIDFCWNRRQNALLATGLGLAASQIGLFAGSQAGSVLVAATEPMDPQRIVTIAVLVLTTFAACGMMLAAYQGGSAQADDLAASETQVRDRCLKLCATAGISDRTCEVVTLYVLGRTRARIGQMLFISENTVNYHLRKAYQQLSISTKQELLDLVYKSED